MMKYFRGSFIFTGVALAMSAVVGYYYGGAQMALALFFSAVMLGVLETCVSFDNAIVNATVLRDMDDKWRHRFLTWGMVIAVFGMRVVFPVLIVALAANVNSFINWGSIFSGGPLFEGTAVHMALFDPAAYKAAITSANTQIMGFGGVFLLMVFLTFFLDNEKDSHWIPILEKPMGYLGNIQSVSSMVTLILLMVISPLMVESTKFFSSGLIGLISYLAVKGLGDLLNGEGDATAGTAAKSGIGAFLYLEVVDASFSFDGVIAAFAVTDNFLIIALGLGIGAMFVRSMTIYMVEKETLNAFKYLEHGAFYAIGLLVAIMFLGAAGVHLGEVAAAGGSLAIIGVAIIHSIIAQKKEQA